MLVWAVEFLPNGCLVSGDVLEKQLCMKLEDDLTEIGLSPCPRLRDWPPVPRGESRNLGKRLLPISV